ncbi:MAG: SDR family NAD(P)-dependent oxidoreductase [Hyphomicrobiaceae bacterium]|nr:SDR family NAD(P)-dependent oxidoreductase [Hyphomicrobiaceae bacterium]MCC0022829.1 SDR family NAD(P)-dependent oxidoreductase [Hyphomicrobiaceae bacterium]
MQELRRIAITGASSGLGAALAKALAQPGVSLHLCARRVKGLEEVAGACRASGAEVQTSSIDLRNPSAGPAWIEAIAAGGPIDLLILNAGIFAGRSEKGVMEPLDAIPGLIATNLTSPLLCATAAVPAMRARGRGHVVLISSLSAVSPSPDSPGYSAAKAGLSAYGKALADDLAGTGVLVHVVEPGHILSHHTDQQIGAVPLAITPEAAADHILRGVKRGAARIAFPLLPRLYVRLTDLLPRPIRLLLNRSQRFTVRNDPDPLSGE